MVEFDKIDAGDVFSKSEQILFCGDCVEVLKQFPSRSVDLVVTSPPYNLDIEYNRYHDNLGWSRYLCWSEKWLRQVFRVLKEEGSFFLNVAGSSRNPMVPFSVLTQANLVGFILQNNITWVKSIFVPKSVHLDDIQRILNRMKTEGVLTHRGHSFGHFKPTNSDRYLNRCHESVFHLTKTGDVLIHRLAVGVPYVHPSNYTRWKSQEQKLDKTLRCQGNVWMLPYDTRKEKADHPATFPVGLAENCIKLHFGMDRKRQGLILDPFVGSGTTNIGALRCRHSCVGIEVDASYFEMAKNRVMNYEPKKNVIMEDLFNENEI